MDQPWPQLSAFFLSEPRVRHVSVYELRDGLQPCLLFLAAAGSLYVLRSKKNCFMASKQVWVPVTCQSRRFRSVHACWAISAQSIPEPLGCHAVDTWVSISLQVSLSSPSPKNTHHVGKVVTRNSQVGFPACESGHDYSCGCRGWNSSPWMDRRGPAVVSIPATGSRCPS